MGSKTEETYYYSAKVHNTAPKAQKVKAYYVTDAPVAEKVVEEIKVVEPRQQAVFAPRTYKIEEGPEMKYELQKVEVVPETEIVETVEKVEPVVFETRSYVAEQPREEIEVRITENEGRYALAPSTTTEEIIYTQ